MHPLFHMEICYTEVLFRQLDVCFKLQQYTSGSWTNSVHYNNSMGIATRAQLPRHTAQWTAARSDLFKCTRSVFAPCAPSRGPVLRSCASIMVWHLVIRNQPAARVTLDVVSVIAPARVTRRSNSIVCPAVMSGNGASIPTCFISLSAPIKRSCVRQFLNHYGTALTGASDWQGFT